MLITTNIIVIIIIAIVIMIVNYVLNYRSWQQRTLLGGFFHIWIIQILCIWGTSIA